MRAYSVGIKVSLLLSLIFPKKVNNRSIYSQRPRHVPTLMEWRT